MRLGEPSNNGVLEIIVFSLFLNPEFSLKGQILPSLTELNDMLSLMKLRAKHANIKSQ